MVDHRLRIRDWQPVMEKVETRLGGWRARFLSRGGGGGWRLVLLKAVLSAIPTYFMAIFRMPAGVQRRMESVMQGFFWRGSRQEGSRGVALVAWEIVCHPVSQGGLGVPHFQHVNRALLTKWVARLMQLFGDMVAAILRDGYGASLDWQIWQNPRRGDSAFMSSLRQSSRQCNLSSDLSWAQGSLSSFGRTSGRGMDGLINSSLAFFPRFRSGRFCQPGMAERLGAGPAIGTVGAAGA